MKHQNCFRPIALGGFSLVEMVCVIAIIGVLVSMLVPAIQAVRESARNVTCLNNLRQIGIANLSFESAHQAFPSGTLGFEGTVFTDESDFPRWSEDSSYQFYMHKNQNTSLFVILLPFMEQTSLKDQLPKICFDVHQDYSQWRLLNGGPGKLHDVAEVSYVMQKSLLGLSCPSDIGIRTKVFGAGSQPAYDPSTERDGFMYFETSLPMAKTNYIGVAGAYSGGKIPDADRRRFDGIFGSRIQKPISVISDGTSNTFMVGESLGLISARNRIYSNPWFFATLGRARSDLDWRLTVSSRSPGLQMLGDEWFAHQSGFASIHPSTVNFLRADGSVTSLVRTISIGEFYSSCGIADGEINEF